MPLDAIAAYLNFDMVGRMQDNKLTVQATGTSPAWAQDPRAGEHRGRLRPRRAGGSVSADRRGDVQPGERAVACSFFTGTHADYHKPSDTADKIDYEDLDRVVDFAAAIVRRLEDADRGAGVHEGRAADCRPAAAAPACAIFTGTIPDYSTEVKGLLLGGVVGGGPAEQAGLQKGDVIVEIAGQTIANIYDYTYALDVLKIGQPAKVVYMREGKKHETMLTPAARK